MYWEKVEWHGFNHSLIYIPSMFTVWSKISAGSWLCVLQGHAPLLMRAFSSAFTHPLYPHDF